MKRKLLLSILICMFMCILNVKAEDSVKIKSIELVNKSEAVIELEQPKFSDLNLDLNLQLFKVGDYAEYKITIENLTNQEVIIKNNGKNITKTNENITYDYIWDNNNSTVPVNGTKSFNLKVEYTTRLEEESFNENDEYITTDNLKIEMSQEKQTIPTNNNNQNKKEESSPQTGDIVIDYVVLIVIAVTLIFDIIYFAIIKKDNNKFNKIILIGSFVILLSSIIIKETFAFTYAEMNVKTNIKINKLPKMLPNCLSNKVPDRVLNQLANATSNEDLENIELEEDHNRCFSWNDIIDPDEAAEHFIILDERNIQDSLYTKLIVTVSKNMPSKYKFRGITYNLKSTKDLSLKQNGSVILGIYKGPDNGILLLLGGDGGVEAPQNSAYLFAGTEVDTSSLWRVYESGTILSFANYFDLNNLDVSKVTNMSHTFWFLSYFDSDDDFKIDKWDTSSLLYMNEMFEYFGWYSNTSEVHLSFKGLDTSNVIEMTSVFLYAFRSNKHVYLDLSNWNTSNVVNMQSMFDSIGSGEDSYWTRPHSILIHLDLSNWNTSKVKNMSDMFSYGEFKELDISPFNMANVVNTEGMFNNCYKLETIYVSDTWDISNVSNTYSMFNECNELKGGAGTIYDSSKTDASYAHIDGGTSNPGYLTLKSN